MHKKARFAGVITATAGLLLAGAPAFADSADNDGINVGNDNDVSLVPIQLCGNNVAVVGAVVNILSPQSGDCTNAPVGDHPSHKPDHEKPEKPGHEKPEKPGHGGGCDDDDCGGCDDDCGGGGPDWPGPGGPGPGEPGPGPAPAPAPAPSAPEQVSPAELPAAPSPVAVAGHAAVTG
ncbi:MULTISPECIES: chaplin family protein [unclassified Saccharopolyspora]|uniref:chaplin family protein n=1 Tax=unclassified Saccharopolyspora TaxID=2646250 RepID=UPI001CD2B389|nr:MULTISPECIES: chaplin family protein [unclassified Saccharopolyspora]MCA1192112.1 DUF320 domain-containing protein [Saccharopolyspora sp. 6V]MCA1226140.1 DUF320 domain-containing protein [Saccharopolyspora sp. 6M]